MRGFPWGTLAVFTVIILVSGAVGRFDLSEFLIAFSTGYTGFFLGWYASTDP